MNEIYTNENFDNSKIPKKLKIAYLTRGISSGGFGTETTRLLWDGIYTACHKENIQLLTFIGGHDNFIMDNYIYNLVHDDLVDGIVTWASSDINEALDILIKYKKTPVVTLSVETDRYPVVSIDNKSGMIDIISHLINRHNAKNIGFVQGPIKHSYAIQRIKAYKEALEINNLSFDELYLSEPLGWNKQTGKEAVDLFLDKRGLIPGKDLDAIVCVNDRIAIGAIEELAKRGYECPRDIMVTGFNNHVEATSHIPSITSISMPFMEQAQLSIKVLKRLITTGRVEKISVLPSRPAIHESCGCPNAWTNNNLPEGVNDLNVGKTVEELKRIKNEFIAELMDPIYYMDIMYNIANSQKLIDCFIKSFELENPKPLVDSIVELITNNPNFPLDIIQWQTIFSYLKQTIYKITLNKKTLLLTENILNGALGTIMDLHIKSEAIIKMDQILQGENLNAIDKSLADAMNMNSVIESLADILPKVGIYTFALAVFDHEEDIYDTDLPNKSKLLLSFTNNIRDEIPSNGIVFNTRKILPNGFPKKDSFTAFLCRALSFRKEKLGYVVFEVNSKDGTIYEAVTIKLAAAIKSVYLSDALRKKGQILSVTNQKLAEQQYILDTFIESVPDMIHFKKPDGEITKVNSAFVEKLGYKNHSDIVGNKAKDIFPEEHMDIIKIHEEEILSEKKKSINITENIQFPGGFSLWFHTSKMPLYDHLGTINGMFEISRDVTDLKEINDNLEQSILDLKKTQEQLVEAEKMAALGELVVGVSHEINTPLGVCITAASYLDMQITELQNLITKYEKTHKIILNISANSLNESLDIINRNLKKVSDLIQSFKQIAMESSYGELVKINLFDFLENLKIYCYESFLSENYKFIIRCSNKQDLVSDTEVLFIIFTHLIRNSVYHGFEFIENGEIRIEVSPCEDGVNIVYKDNGKGINNNILEKIFNPFFTTKRGFGGSGLGMHIVYNLVSQKLKGSIKCESEEGKGILFYIHLPQKKTP